MPENFPLVSIVTPSFNQGQYLERTLLSVVRQDYPNIEYIIVDALSNDETTRILDKYRDQIDILIREKDNGQTDALNKGFARSSGAVLAYLNADDCFSGPTVVRHAVEQILEHEADVVYGRRYRITGDGHFLDCYPFREFESESIEKFNIIPQECAFWTRKIYDDAGGFFQSDLRFSMDYELWLRFLRTGAKFKAINKVYGFFRWHVSQKSQTIWREVCLPEVRRIQHAHNGQPRSTGEMEQHHESFYYGTDLTSSERQRALATRLWKAQQTYMRGVLCDIPLDYWVFAT